MKRVEWWVVEKRGGSLSWWEQCTSKEDAWRLSRSGEIDPLRVQSNFYAAKVTIETLPKRKPCAK